MDCSGLPATGGSGVAFLGFGAVLLAVGLVVAIATRRRGAAAACALLVLSAALALAPRVDAAAPCGGGGGDSDSPVATGPTGSTGTTEPSTPPITAPQGEVVLCSTATIGNLVADVLFTRSGDQLHATFHPGTTNGTGGGPSVGGANGFIAATPQEAASHCAPGTTAEPVADQASFNPAVPADWWICVTSI